MGVADCVDQASLICLSVCARACARVCSCQAAGLAGPPVLLWADVCGKASPEKKSCKHFSNTLIFLQTYTFIMLSPRASPPLTSQLYSAAGPRR